jgi:hypothetical protein
MDSDRNNFLFNEINMELTGKAEKAFDKWYCLKRKKEFSINYLIMIQHCDGETLDPYHLRSFLCSPKEMQFGVLVEFFHAQDQMSTLRIFEHISNGLAFTAYSLNELQTQAIEKEVERFNNL